MYTQLTTLAAPKEPDMFDYKIIDGRKISKTILDQVFVGVKHLIDRGLLPKIASISIGENPAVNVYIRN